MGQLAGLAGAFRQGMNSTAEETQSSEAPSPVRAPQNRTAARPKTPTLVKLKPKERVPKSKDPDWKAYSLFLKKDTHSEMNFILRRMDEGDDMSDLVQRLVEGWVADNKAKYLAT